MFSLGERHKYYLYNDWVDMRKGFNGLSGLVRNDLGLDPLTGDVYIFINRSRNRMKLLVWEQGGYVLYYKRLEQGRFRITSTPERGLSLQYSWEDLMLLVGGIERTSLRRHKRFLLKNKHKKEVQKVG